jgi:hypothetical protein
MNSKNETILKSIFHDEKSTNEPDKNEIEILKN